MDGRRMGGRRKMGHVRRWGGVCGRAVHLQGGHVIVCAIHTRKVCRAGGELALLDDLVHELQESCSILPWRHGADLLPVILEALEHSLHLLAIVPLCLERVMG